MITLKRVFRKKILSLLRQQNELERIRNSDIIKNKLFRSKQYRRAKLIFFYLSFDGEVDTFLMIKEALMQGKKIAVPVCDVKNKKIIPVNLTSIDKDHLIKGAYGIMHPRIIKRIPLKNIDLAVVPGVAFDKEGNRLGRGKGYYDRFLSRIGRCDSIGLAFRFQVVNKLPGLHPHDFPVNKIITN